MIAVARSASKCNCIPSYFDRASSDKPDSKTLPWLQVNPSSKMDTSARLKPKSMKDFFILINGRGDDYSESEEKSYDFQAGFPR